MEKLYWIYYIGGSLKDLKIGDNIKDRMSFPNEFEDDIKLLDRGVDFFSDIHYLNEDIQFVKKYGEKGYKNRFVVIVEKTGIIRGMIILSNNGE